MTTSSMLLGYGFLYYFPSTSRATVSHDFNFWEVFFSHKHVRYVLCCVSCFVLVLIFTLTRLPFC